MMPVVYGPVRSWRLRISLGINLLGESARLCCFDCLYCELAPSSHRIVRRKEFVTLDQLRISVERVSARDFDYVTFSGAGEPTLASNLGEAIDLARAELKKPVAVITNAVLMTREDVRLELARADTVFAKIDAPDETLYRRINRPAVRTTLREIIDAVKVFHSSFHGRLALQMMFTEVNKGAASEMVRIASEIAPDEVHLNTPLHPCAVSPLPPAEMHFIKTSFHDIPGVRMVYDELPSITGVPAGRTA